MDLASEKYAQLIFRGKSERKILNDQPLITLTRMRDLSFFVRSNLSWSCLIKERLCRANKKFYCLPRNVAYRVKTVAKLGLYRFIILPVVSYDLTCAHLTRGIVRDFQSFQNVFIEMGLWHSRQRSKVQRTAVATNYPSTSSPPAINRHLFSL